jgi:hypothetical protein
VTNILILVEEEIFPQGSAPRERRFVTHLDNCSIQISRVSTDWLEEHDIVRMSQPPCSPVLAPRAPTCFLPLKKKLERIQLADENQFFESLQAILSDLDHEGLNVVFQACVRRVHEVSEANGGYVG